jgi:DNA processing protein
MTGGFWQLLLAAEATPAKGRALLQAVGPHCVDKEEFLATGLLSAAEAARVGAADTDAWNGKGHALPQSELPERFGELSSAPLALFVAGDAGCLARPCVAIVGTRACSSYGKLVARKYAAELGEAGATIISGGALGIDAAAHDGGLSVGAPTIAVFAGGIDQPYPHQNLRLFRQMAEGAGCLVSGYAFGTKPARHRFLERNDVIAALADVVIVIEAPLHSGALRTAATARSLNRPLFAIPGTIDLQSFKGSHALIRAGATLTDEPSQIAHSLGLADPAKSMPYEAPSELAAAILNLLTTTPQGAEKLADQLGVSPQKLLAELTMLEIDEKVARDSGGYALVP